MKKVLLLLGFVLATLCADAQTAQSVAFAGGTQKAQRSLKAPTKAFLKKVSVPKDDKPLFNPEGEEEGYIMTYTDNNGFYEQTYTNGKVTVRRNGSTYYFNSLTPGGNRSYRGAEESWLKGDRVGDEIVVKAGQVLVENQAKKLYLEVVHADESGNITSFEEEARLKIGADGELTTQNNDILAIYEDADNEEDAGFFGFFYDLDLKPMGELVRFEFPKGVTPQTYVLSGTDVYGEKSARLVKVAFDDGKFYISGLASTSPDEVYEGTYTATTASIPSFQIVKDADMFYYRIAPVVVDDDMNFSYKYSIDFDLSADHKTLTLASDVSYLCEISYDLNEIVTNIGGVTIKQYAGDHAAKPAAPQIEQWDELNNALVFNVPTEDVDGEYINPDKLSYRFYADGKPYVFTTADYERLTDDMTDIPFDFTDNFDIANNGVRKIVYFHNLNCKKLHVESVYTVDGVATASDRTLYDFDPTAINANSASNAVVATEYYSPEGLRLAQPQRGSVVIEILKYADGSTRTAKLIAK